MKEEFFMNNKVNCDKFEAYFVFKDENERICLDFLKNNKNFAPCGIDSKLPCEKTAVGVSFFPDISFGAGFYVCKLKKD